MALKRNNAIKLAKEVVSALKKNFSISRAYMFGSYAHGHPNQWSDIDLALVSPQFKGVRFFDIKKLIPHLRNCPGLVELHPFREKDFTPDNLFIREIMKNGIRIG